jgi:PAS domain S-box-containing protein
MFAAAGVTVTLIRITRQQRVWALFGTAIVLLAVARAVSLTRSQLDPVTETIYLLFSILILGGLLGARPLCHAFRSSVDRLADAKKDLFTVEQQLRHVLTSAPIVIFAVDTEGIFTLSEGRGLESLGLEPGQIVGQSVFDVYEDNPDIVSCIRRSLAGEEVTASVDVVDLSYETHYSPLFDDNGAVSGVLGVAADVSRRKRSEAQLRSTKDRFRALVETTSDWVWEIDADAQYTYVGPKVVDLLGYDPDELIGKTPFDLMAPDDAKRVREQFRRFASERSPFAGLININLHKDGFPVILETSGVPVFDDDGHLIGYRGIDRDITTRMKAEEALRASENRLNLAMVAANMGTWDWDIGTNKVTWSEKVEGLFGLKRGSFDGTYETYVTLLHPDDRDHVQFAINAALEGKVSPYRVLHRIIRPDGELRWLEGIGQVVRNDDGEAVRMLGVVTDVTDQELAEQKLRQEKETAQMYLDTAGVIMMVIDTAGTIELINHKGVEMLDYPEGEVVGKGFMRFVPDSVKADVGRFSEKIINGEMEVLEYYEAPVVSRAGEERLVAWHAVPIRGEDDRVTGMLVSGSDITEKRRAELAQRELEDQLRHSQRMETIGTLAGGIAHDFNKILSPILGYADMAMEDAGDDSPIHGYLERVVKATHRAKELVEQILLFSKQGDREQSPIHIHLIIRQALKLVRASLPTTIEIQQNINIESGVVMANASQMDQVLVNLCANAAHAMRDDGGLLRVELEPLEVDDGLAAEHTHLQPGPHARLRVSDSGKGMDRDTVERIFEPFFSTRDVGEGTGLGLSVVHGIVTSHGGDIAVESELGKGTSATVYLPHTEREVEAEEELRDIDVTGSEHVLFVDDEPEIVKLGRRVLERFGYRVTTADNGDEALEIIRNDPGAFDVLVSDQTMPHKTGLVLAEEVRTIRGRLPIILMTGFSDKITPEKLEELNISRLIMKPLLGRTLGVAIRRALDIKLVHGEE